MLKIIFFWKSATVVPKDFLASLTTFLAICGGEINMGFYPIRFVILSVDWNVLVIALN